MVARHGSDAIAGAAEKPIYPRRITQPEGVARALGKVMGLGQSPGKYTEKVGDSCFCNL
jgi:hypothetical protein